MTSHFDALGGEPALRAIIARFVERVCDDLMIGFFFARVNRERLRALEYEHAAEHLGGPVEYTGRPLAAAHARHPIQGGHFQRRQQILREVLAEHGVPAPIREAWLAHTESLRPLITRDAGSECDGAALVAPGAALVDPGEGGGSGG